MSDRKTAILRAALATFIRYGFRRSAMEDIAVEAGISRPALYQYFKGKTDVITHVIDLVIEDAFALAEASLEGKTTPQDRVTAYLTTYFSFYHRLLVNSPHADEMTDIKAKIGGDHHARAQRRLIKRVNDLAQRDADDDLGTILVHGGEGLKYHAPDEATLIRQLGKLSRALV